MSVEFEPIPWMCHVCNETSTTSDGKSCSVCYKIACSKHLRHVPALNNDTGLFELRTVCITCALEHA